MSTLILALHGTRRASGTAFADRLREAVAARLPGVDVRLGFVDIHDERLADVVARQASSVIVPVFLAAGYHVDHDVALAVQASGGRAVATSHVGPELTAAIAERLRQAGGPGDAVVLAAIGSSRPGAQAEVHATARRLSGLVGRPVEPGFIFASEPSLADAVAGLRKRGHRTITVATHAILPGLYQLHIAELDLPASQPIGLHPRLLDAITSRYLAATLVRAA